MEGQITLGRGIPQNVGQPYQLVIEGIVGQGFDGTIAVDDLSMSYGSCSTTCKFLFTHDVKEIILILSF